MKSPRIIGVGISQGSRVLSNVDLWNSEDRIRYVPQDEERRNEMKHYDAEEALRLLVKIGANIDGLGEAEKFDLWVRYISGIEQRYYCNKDENALTLAVDASKMALENAGVKAGDLDFIISHCFTPPDTMANFSCEVGYNIGADGINGLCINNHACAGTPFCLHEAYLRITSGNYNLGLIVLSEALSRVADFKKAKTAILFSDVSAAMVLKADEKGNIRSLPYCVNNYSEQIRLMNSSIFDAEDILSKDEVDYVKKSYMDLKAGKHIIRAAISGMEDAYYGALLCERYGRNNFDSGILRLSDKLKEEFKGERERSILVPHQANENITIGLADRLGYTKDRIIDTIAKDGNGSAASVTRSYYFALQDGRIKEGTRVIMPTTGGSYSKGGAIIEH